MNQEELKKALEYNPNTGIFTWLKTNSNRAKAGSKSINNKNRYTLIGINGKKYSAHRLAFLYMTGSFPSANMDHINGVKNDNRWVNLREAAYQQNNCNRNKSKNNKTKVKGVTKIKNVFRATATFNGKQHYLGCYKTKEEAGKAYQDFASTNHGTFYKGK